MTTNKVLGSATMLVAVDGTPVSAESPLPVAIEGGISLLGPVTVSNEVEIKNESGNPVPVESTRTAPADRSGSIAAGGVAQQVAGASASRRGFLVQNLSTGDLWVSTIGVAAAAAGSLRIPIGGYFESPAGMAVTGAISIFGSTTGQSFTAREW